MARKFARTRDIVVNSEVLVSAAYFVILNYGKRNRWSLIRLYLNELETLPNLSKELTIDNYLFKKLDENFQK